VEIKFREKNTPMSNAGTVQDGSAFPPTQVPTFRLTLCTVRIINTNNWQVFDIKNKFDSVA